MSDYFENNSWITARLGRFTASEIHKLFVGGKEPMTEEELKVEKANKGRRTTKDTLFGDGARTYIRTKAAEILTQEVKDQIDFKQAEWGKANEYEALVSFQKLIGKEYSYYGVANPTFFEYGKFAGGSPDFEDEEEGGDVKCPFCSDAHLLYLLLQSAEDLKKNHFDYYCQLQMNMLIRKWKKAFFVSYDPRMVEYHHRLKVVEVFPDDEWIREFKIRLYGAIIHLQEILDVLNGPTVFVAADDKQLQAMISEDSKLYAV